MNPVLCQLRKLIARADDLIDIVYPPEPPIPPTTLEAALLLLIPTAGLFKDVAGTIPATVAGDKIAAWKDMRNGLMFTQATVDSQPTLAFVQGKPVVRFVETQRLALVNNFAGITVNSSAIFGYYPSDTSYSIFDGPNEVGYGSFTRYHADGKMYSQVFLGTRMDAWMDVPASGKMVTSISRQEASYNGRINGVQTVSSPAQPLVNTGSLWGIGTNVQSNTESYFTGDIFGIAIYSTPAGTSHATHIAGVTEIENYISTFYPELVATLDWNPASGVFKSTIGPTPVFSRASAATMIDVTGKVVWGPENLLRQSQAFDVTWAGASLVAFGGGSVNIATAPDGTMSADKAIPDLLNTSDHVLYQGITTAGGQHTFTIYLKNAGYNFAYVSPSTFNLGGGVVNLTTGEVTSPDAGSTFIVTVLPSGWVKVSVTRNLAAGTVNVGFYVFNTAALASFPGDGVSGVLAWGAQLEKGPVARTYLPTTTAPVYGPRITYDPISHQCLGYLAEEQRTNLLLQSNTFQTSWSKEGATLAAGSIDSPLGTGMGCKIIEDLSTGDHRIFQNVSLPAGSVTWSVFAKAGEVALIGLGGHDGTTEGYAQFNLSNGTISSTPPGGTATIKSFGGGWYQLSVTRTVAAATGYILLRIQRNAGNYAGDGSSGLYVSGAQIEAGSFPTSYIPTTTAAVTRSADLCSISGTDFTGFYNQTEGTVVVDFIPPPVDIGRSPYAMGFFGASGWPDQFSVQMSNSTSSGYDHPNGVITTGGTHQFQRNSANAELGKTKVALAASPSSTNMAVQGVLTGADDTSGIMPPVNRLSIGLRSEAITQLDGTIARLQYFPTRLPNAKLIELTMP